MNIYVSGFVKRIYYNPVDRYVRIMINEPNRFYTLYIPHNLREDDIAKIELTVVGDHINIIATKDVKPVITQWENEIFPK